MDWNKVKHFIDLGYGYTFITRTKQFDVRNPAFFEVTSDNKISFTINEYVPSCRKRKDVNYKLSIDKIEDICLNDLIIEKDGVKYES